MPPAAALQAATLNTARALGQETQLGSIKAGKQADLIILSADPLLDVKNTRKIEVVIKGGRVLHPKTLLKAVPVQ